MLMHYTDRAAFFLIAGLCILGVAYDLDLLLKSAGGFAIGIGLAYLKFSSWQTKTIIKRQEQLDEHMEFIKKHQASCTFRTNMPD